MNLPGINPFFVLVAHWALIGTLWSITRSQSKLIKELTETLKETTAVLEACRDFREFLKANTAQE